MTETQAKWAGRVSEWRNSGQSAEEFVQGRGFEASTLRYWASRLKKEPSNASDVGESVVRLARVVRRSRQPREVGSDAGIVLEVGPARIVVHRGFDAMVLRDLVGALQSNR